MANGVRDCLLRDAKSRKLHLGRRTVHALIFDRDWDARHPSRTVGKPVKRRTHAEIIEQRQPKLTGDVTQLVSDCTGVRGGIAVPIHL